MNQNRSNSLEQHVLAILAEGGARDPREILASLLGVASDVLRDKDEPPQSFSPLVLVAIAAEMCNQKKTVARLLDAATRRRCLLAAYPKHALMTRLALLRDVPTDALERQTTAFIAACEMADLFKLAIAPRRLAIVARSHNFTERISMWHSRVGWTDSDIQACAERVFGEVLADGSAVAELIRLIPPRRLATYTDEDLRRFAAHHLQWSGLVHLLTRRQHAPTTPAATKQFTMLRRRMVRTIARMRHSRFTEDAVDAALAQTLAGLDDPDRGYAYEQDFFRWLLAQAMAESARLAYERRRERDLLAAPEPARRAAQTQADRYEAVVQHVCRLCFVQHLFDDHRERLLHLWFLRLLYDDAFTDVMLSKLLEMACGQCITAQALGLMRFRLRQRLAVLEYVLDRFDGAANAAGLFDPPLGHAGMLMGKGSEGSFALRRAASYAWAARADADPLLLWATVVCGAIECSDVGVEDAILRGRRMIELWHSAGGVGIGPLARQELEQRFERLRQWCDTSAAALAALRRIAAVNRIRYLIGVCVYLRIVQLRTIEQSLEIIRLDTTEAQAAWRSMLEVIRSP